MPDVQANGRERIDWHQFNHPKIVFAEKFIPAGESRVIEQHELKVSRDMVVDYLAISDDSFTTDSKLALAPNMTLLHWLVVNWGVVERPTWIPIGFGMMEEFHNFFEGDRLCMPIVAFGGMPSTLFAWGPLRWRHSEPWLYNPIDSVSIDVVAPPPPGNVTIGTPRYLGVFMDGVGLKSGMRRSFVIGQAQVGGQAPGIPFSQSFSAPQTMANLGDETFKMQAVGLGFSGRGWNDVASLPVDNRLLNFFRMRVVPSIGDSWSDTPVPLVFYGIQQAPPWRLAIHKPVGGPIFLYAGQSIIFNIENLATAGNTGLNDDIDLNVQVALIGRTAPGIGSLV